MIKTLVTGLTIVSLTQNFCEGVYPHFVTPIELINNNIEYQKNLEKQNMLKEMGEALYHIQQEKQRKLQQYYDNICYYNPYNVSEPSNISKERISKLLEGTSFNNEDVIETMYNGERNNIPINAVFLISMLRWESGHGFSKLAQSHNNISSVKSRSGNWRSYNSYNECVIETIELLTKDYLNPNGKYYNGKSIWNINEKYCETNEWADSINKIAQEIRNK